MRSARASEISIEVNGASDSLGFFESRHRTAIYQLSCRSDARPTRAAEHINECGTRPQILASSGAGCLNVIRQDLQLFLRPWSNVLDEQVIVTQ
jgi:hypothetical protein